MTLDNREQLRAINTFPSLVEYLRDELDWPIDTEDFEGLTFEYSAEELGIDEKSAAKIQEIKRLRPLSASQPWGIFFVEFESKQLPVVALRRILSRVVLKNRASANQSERAAWALDDLLFISSYGEQRERRITFAHFSEDSGKGDLPTLKVLGWDNLDTPLHLDRVADKLTTSLRWPDNESDSEAWRGSWRTAFTERHREEITTSRDLSIRLAELARVIRQRISSALSVETADGSLTKLLKAFRDALVHDLDEEGFADMYAQTIAYGLLSARMTDPNARTTDHLSAHMRTNPLLAELLTVFLNPVRRPGTSGGIDFDELGVAEVVELLDDANMEAVLVDFGDRNPEDDPVIRFYEDFLDAYDKAQKISRGVFYTPRPVVSYIVRSVDEALRVEYGLEDGLADISTWGEMASRNHGMEIPDGVGADEAFVQILDPATGTGTFLVEVIEQIHRTMVTKWTGQGQSEETIQSSWNEYVPKHLLPRLHGYELLMAPYAIAHLKIGLKLYESGYNFESTERASVYLTNALEPPNSGQLRLDFLPALAEEAAAVNCVKRKHRFTVVLGNPPYARSSVNSGEHAEALVRSYKDLVRDEKNIQPLSDDYIKFLGLTQEIIGRSTVGLVGLITNNSFLSGRIHRGIRAVMLDRSSSIALLNLHGSQKVDFLGAAGVGDQNVFDIQQGVAISLTVVGGKAVGARYAELVGSREQKFEHLVRGDVDYVRLNPVPPYYLMVPQVGGRSEYETWPSLTDVMPFQSVGGKPGDDKLLVAISRPEVIPKLVGSIRLMSEPAARSRLTEAGRKLAALAPMEFDDDLVRPYAYRPFDLRYAYYDSRIWTRPLVRLKACLDGSPVLLATKLVKDASFAHVFVTRQFPDVIFLSNTSSVNCYAFPARPPRDEGAMDLICGCSNYRPGVLGFVATDPEVESRVLYYVYAVMHSPNYRKRYLEYLRMDFPRVPVAGSTSLAESLIALGSSLVPLHLMESPLLENTVATYQGPPNPEVVGVQWEDDVVRINAGPRGSSGSHSSSAVCFNGVPAEVWGFRIGGYQVCEKWLKDRKGRTLSEEDIAHYQKIVVAISETIRIMGEIDRVIDEHGGWPGAFLASDEGGEVR